MFYSHLKKLRTNLSITRTDMYFFYVLVQRHLAKL